MKFKLFIALAPFLALFCFPAFAQRRDTVALNTIIGKAVKVAEIQPIEKLYIHFDKPYYAVSDTIWFKAYLTYGIHQPSELSKIIYVDIMNSRDQMIESVMLPVKNGTASGLIALTQPQYDQDSYHIRAYTRWMSNFDKAYFFHKTIIVGNAINKPVSSTVNIKRSAANNQTGINAQINYTDADGYPFANKKVNWVVTDDGEDIAKGKGTTDAQGKLDLGFINSGAKDLFSAQLKTTLDAGNRKNYEQAYSLKSVALPADVQFFPESGSLVNGVRSKVAIKAIQPDGLGADFSATIVDNAGATITTCTAKHAGMGFFLLTPETGKTYKANITFKDGSKDVYELPPTQAEGYNLNVSNIDTGKLFIKLSTNAAYLAKNANKTYYLLGRSGQIICYAAKITLSSLDFSAYIPTNKFPTGTVQLTLLNAFGQPVSERLVFVSHKEQLGLTISSDKPAYSNRKKVLLNVTAANALKPAEGDLSIAVVNETKIPYNEDAETTILSSLLLTSDIKGYIENPNYYFKKPNENTAADLDLLLLTQGYRRFTYAELLSKKPQPVMYLPEQGIDLTGTLRTLDGMPVKGGTVTLSIPEKYYSTRATSDIEGRFKFTNLVFTDSAKVVVSAKGNYNSKNMMLTIDGVTYPGGLTNPNEPDERLNIDTLISGYLVNSKKIYENSRTLQEVVIKAKAITKPAPSHSDYSSLSGLSMPDHLVPGDRFKGCNDLMICMQGMVTGVTYDNFNFYVTRDFNQGRKTPMSIFVRGMPVDINYLSSIKASDIESVEVFLKDELGLVNRMYQTSGVLVINTKSIPQGTKISLAELEELLPQANVAKISPRGYNIPKAFYSPKYTVTGNGGSFGPDLRTTVYWNPRLYTDATTGKTSAEFFTPDGKGTYRAVVEGIDKDGHIGRAVYRFKVQ